MKKEYTVLSNGVKMPNLAFGTFCKFISDNEVEIDGVLYEIADPEGVVMRGNYFVKIKEK